MRTCPKNRRPLSPNELPEPLRGIFDYSSQDVEYIPRRKKRLMIINRTCPRCYSSERIPVGEIRSALRIGTLSGYCRGCVRIVLAPEKRQRKGNASPHWKGGRRITPRGYIMLHCPNHPMAQNGYVQEHRLVMEAHWGRYLLPTEMVHHKNGNKSDNRLENLELWGISHSNGFRYEDLSAQQLKDLITYLQELCLAKEH